MVLHAFLPPANEVCKGYVFTRVCHSVHRGCLSQCMLGYTPGADTTQEQTPPRSRYPPGADTPTWEQTPSRADTPSWGRHPPCSACWEIRAICGWFASYWNAYLLIVYSKIASNRLHLASKCRVEVRLFMDIQILEYSWDFPNQNSMQRECLSAVSVT